MNKQEKMAGFIIICMSTSVGLIIYAALEVLRFVLMGT